MARKKKVDSQEKMEKKGLEMKPFTISCERHKNMAIVRIAECKDFKLMLATWDEEPTHWTRMHISNSEIYSYNGRVLKDRVSDIVEFGVNMSVPSECWGTDVPDDVRNFLKEKIGSFIIKLPKADHAWTISAAEDRYGFPVSKLSELQAQINGVCMARKKKSRKAGVSKKERTTKETSE